MLFTLQLTTTMSVSSLCKLLIKAENYQNSVYEIINLKSCRTFKVKLLIELVSGAGNKSLLPTFTITNIFFKFQLKSKKLKHIVVTSTILWSLFGECKNNCFCSRFSLPDFAWESKKCFPKESREDFLNTIKLFAGESYI